MIFLARKHQKVMFSETRLSCRHFLGLSKRFSCSASPSSISFHTMNCTNATTMQQNLQVEVTRATCRCRTPPPPPPLLHAAAPRRRQIAGQVRSGRVGLGWGSGRVWSGLVGSGRVGSGQVGSGWVGLGRVVLGRVGAGRVGSG